MIQTGDINQISSLLSPIVSSASKVYTDFPFEAKTRSFFSRFLKDRSPSAESLSNVLQSTTVLPLKDIINQIRNLKSDAEIANMRKAGQASGRAFTDAMRRAWTKEKDLAAYMEYKFRTNTCDGSAYIPVVAGGEVRSALAWTVNMLLTPAERQHNPLYAE